MYLHTNMSSIRRVVSDDMSFKGKLLMIHRTMKIHRIIMIINKPDGGLPKVPTFKI